MMNNQDLVFRLRERARIRRQIPGRRSVQEGQPDRLSDLLEEAADEIERLKEINTNNSWIINPDRMGR
jgi:hypothetical protein